MDTDYWLKKLSLDTSFELAAQNLKKAIDIYTTDIKAFYGLKEKPELFFLICKMVYGIEKNSEKLAKWRKCVPLIDPKYFFDSILFVPELEKVRFDAFKVVHHDLYE